jgi:hypothetical protein
VLYLPHNFPLAGQFVVFSSCFTLVSVPKIVHLNCDVLFSGIAIDATAVTIAALVTSGFVAVAFKFLRRCFVVARAVVMAEITNDQASSAFHVSITE